MRILMSSVYQVPYLFVIGDATEDTTRYDVAVNGPRNEDAALKKLLPDLLSIALHVTATKETRNTEGWILTAPNGLPKEFQEAASTGGTSSVGHGSMKMAGMRMSNLAGMAQTVLRKPVVDKTGITGRYDFTLKYDDARPESLLDQLRELGFALEAATLPTEFLVVTKK